VHGYETRAAREYRAEKFKELKERDNGWPFLAEKRALKMNDKTQDLDPNATPRPEK
jgi:hypothetical protein